MMTSIGSQRDESIDSVVYCAGLYALLIVPLAVGSTDDELIATSKAAAYSAMVPKQHITNPRITASQIFGSVGR